MLKDRNKTNILDSCTDADIKRLASNRKGNFLLLFILTQTYVRIIFSCRMFFEIVQRLFTLTIKFNCFSIRLDLAKTQSKFPSFYWLLTKSSENLHKKSVLVRRKAHAKVTFTWGLSPMCMWSIYRTILDFSSVYCSWFLTGDFNCTEDAFYWRKIGLRSILRILNERFAR